MEFRGTKGDWKTVKTYNRKEMILSGKTIVATCEHYLFSDFPPAEEAEANAKIIAAAPQLLEALRKSDEMLQELCEYAPNPMYGLLDRIATNKKLIRKSLNQNP